MRAPFQVLIFPFANEKNGYLYAIFERKDLRFWQGISGGGEDKETPIEAAKREAFEETQIDKTSRYVALDSMTTIPIASVGNYKWKEGILVLPEYSFGVEVFSKDLKVGKEHSNYKWLSYEKARQLLKYDSNKTALWELDHRLNKRRKTSQINYPAIRKIMSAAAPEEKHAPYLFQVSLKLILKNKRGEVLILKLPQDSYMAGYYDLPGGRVNSRELEKPYDEIFKREVVEELGKSVKYRLIKKPVSIGRHPYFSRRLQKKMYIIFIFFEALYLGGKIKLSNEHVGYQWLKLTKKNISEYFVRGLREGLKNYFE